MIPGLLIEWWGLIASQVMNLVLSQVLPERTADSYMSASGTWACLSGLH